MRFKSLHDIKVWVKAKQLVLVIYSEMSQSKDYGFKDQIQRAAVSTMNNIAEGSFRESGTEFYRYLEIANSSNIEVKSMLYVAKDLKYLSSEKHKILDGYTEEIIKMIISLQRTLI
ncbi:MAG: four helix bundle protein [Candidatus Roizmanbacteria bacterium]